MYAHVLLALCLIGIPFAYAQENSEIICDIPDPTGSCYKPVPGGNTTTQTGVTTESTVTGVGVSAIVVVAVVAVIAAVLVAFTIRKRKH